MSRPIFYRNSADDEQNPEEQGIREISSKEIAAATFSTDVLDQESWRALKGRQKQ